MVKEFIIGILIFILISSCSGKEEKKLLIDKKRKEAKESMAREVKYRNDMFYEEQAQYKKDSLHAISENENQDEAVETILGDYNGDGKIESAFISPKSGYITFFPDTLGNVTELGKLDPKKSKLINEGDLNNDGAEDFSVYTKLDGLGTLSTFIYNRGMPWRVSLRVILKKDEKVNNEDLEKRIFKENNEIYYYEDEHIEDINLPRNVKSKNKLKRKNITNYKPNY
ncbi:hypothetical protein [Flavobacterium sp. LM4]|uniref:hypothetical protein n=1 Tax=Flavobacterium sp. LM4 TaxID=1938609 RepID=UPI000994131B|nr:hypothetical protein [Flavobacterium sp. LM4]OOV18967.1 hypothetical protein BXU10_04640 [Flavobacterium sp. LM4]